MNPKKIAEALADRADGDCLIVDGEEVAASVDSELEPTDVIVLEDEHGRVLGRYRIAVSEVVEQDAPASDPEPRPTLAVLHDPDATYTDPATIESDDDGYAQDDAGWDISWRCRITYGDDLGEIGDDRGLHVVVSASDNTTIRKVTPVQLRAHAAHLVALADRYEQRQAGPAVAAEVPA